MKEFNDYLEEVYNEGWITMWILKIDNEYHFDKAKRLIKKAIDKDDNKYELHFDNMKAAQDAEALLKENDIIVRDLTLRKG